MQNMSVSEMKRNPPIGHRVYMYKFPNGKIYIGQTKRYLYIRYLDKYKNKPLMDAFREYGWDNTEKIILVDGLDEKAALSEEIRLIKLYNACDPSVGYNISKGGYLGMLGLHHTSETKRKMSASGKGKHNGIHSANYGVHKTEEQKEKIRKSKKYCMKPVCQYSRDGTFIERYESVSSAARAIGTSTKNIRCCISGVSHHACGYVWKYEVQIE